MTFDPHKNFAVSTVATAPSPATSGTSLVLASGEGSRFPQPSTDGAFNVAIYPAGSSPTPSNAEIARCTARSSDTLTLTRAQEGSSARTVVVGDQVTLAITAKTITDIEAAFATSLRDRYLRGDYSKYENMPRSNQLNSSLALTTGKLFLVAIALPANEVISTISFLSSGTGAGSPTHWWFGLYDSSLNQLAVTADQTTTAWASNTLKTLNIATVAAGAASSFTTTYEGLYYVGIMMAATTPVGLPSAANLTGVANTTPLMFGGSDTGQTTPPAFPHTATAMTATNANCPYAAVG